MCSAKIQMPSLMDRKEDIPYICQNLTDSLKEESGKNISYTDFPAILKNYFQRDYIPFNIRGIKSDLERIMIYCPVKFDGDIDYRGWRKILASESNQLNSKDTQSYNIDNIMELLVERMGNDDWPGLHSIKDQLEEKILLRVQEKFSTNKSRAKVLRLLYHFRLQIECRQSRLHLNFQLFLQNLTNRYWIMNYFLY